MYTNMIDEATHLNVNIVKLCAMLEITSELSAGNGASPQHHQRLNPQLYFHFHLR